MQQYRAIKKENGSIRHSVLTSQMSLREPTEAYPATAKALNKINLEQQQMGNTSAAAPANKCVLQSPLWNHLSATQQAVQYQMHLSYSVPSRSLIGQQSEGRRDAGMS